MNPLSILLLALCTWIAVLGINSPWFSLAVTVAALAITPRLSLVVLALALPVFLSLLIIHAPQGDTNIAVALSMRATALIAALLTAGAHVSVPDLAKALQTVGVSPKITYILSNAMQMLPMARRYATTYSEVMRHQGKRGRLRYIVFPLITRMLVQSTERELPLHTAGVMLPGRRTVLRPVPFRLIDAVVIGIGVMATGVAVMGNWA